MKRISQTLRSQRGNAMVLSALILLSLSAVGIVSVQHTNTDLIAAGNQSQASKAALAADVAMNHSRALLGDKATCYNKMLAKLKKEFQELNVGYSEFDCSGRQQFATPHMSMLMIERTTVPGGPDYHLTTVGDGNPLARLQQDIAFDGEIFFIEEVNGIPGWQVEGSAGGGSSLCFQIYDVKARGGIPTLGEVVSQTLCPVSTGRVCFSDDDCDPGSNCQDDHCYCQPRKVVVPGLVRVVMGPTPCELL